MEASRRPDPEPETVRMRGWIDLAVGLGLFAIGAILFVAARDSIAHAVPTSVAIYVLLIAGGLTAVRGIWRLLRAPSTGTLPLGFEARGGYKSLVAWRYLLVTDRKVTRATQWSLVIGMALIGLLSPWRSLELPGDSYPLAIAFWGAGLFTTVVLVWGVLRHSRPALITFVIGAVVLAVGALGAWLVAHNKLPLVNIDPDPRSPLLWGLFIAEVIGAVLAGLAAFFGVLRALFTFFTVVPIGGVWIGTAALVIVLAVMSGFESDLRDKILGSNAHVQIAREDGDFTEWRDIKAQIDRMPGVVASTPFAISEVVVAANNTGMPVIIKGIDPQTVGKVTDLVSDLDDRDAMKRLEPLVTDKYDLRVPQRPRPASSRGTVIDPPPDDMPTPGDPIDYSGENLGSDASEGSGSASGSADGSAAPDSAGGDPTVEAPARPPAGSDRFGGDARKLLDLDDRPERAGDDGHRATGDQPPARAATEPVIDPSPPDLLTTDEPPADYSRPDYAPDSVVKVIDIPFDSPSLSRRTQALPGILVGRELVKQTHLYTGEEVRVVSPLSDPANPDATGTPIPFNRDYRVAGTFFTGMYEYDLKFVYVTLDSLQAFLDRGDTIDGIEIRLTNPDDTDAFVARLQTTFGPRYRVQDWKELNRSLFSALKLEKIAMFLVLGIVIMVASFAIVGVLIMVVQGKARQISLLKTLGASDVGVMQLFAIQGLMIGAIGTVLGVATGLLGCWVGKRYGIPVSPDVYYIDRLPIHIEPMSVIAAASAGILISIAATLYPAILAARIQPAAGLRQ